jgi:hypothetical protein
VHAVLISADYRAQQKQLHDTSVYGVASSHYASSIAKMIERYKIDTLLDYGAGSRLTLIKTIREKALVQRDFEYIPYEPAIEAYSAPPEPAEMVVCIDVLEHIEPEYLDNVLDDLQRCTKRIGFFTISCGPALKILPDGRNAHLIQEPPEWWLPKIMQRFRLYTYQREVDGCIVVVYPVTHDGT